jgi:aspartyl protease family protein
MVRLYLTFIVVAGILSAMVSGGGSRTSKTPEGLEAQAKRQTESTRPESSASEPSSDPSDAIELRREPDGHFYADVEINGTPIRALVDTGASGIALSREDARRAGIGISIGMYEVVGVGASGEVRGERVTLDRVTLGSETVEDMRAIVLDSGDLTLLGQSFLSHFDSVEIQGDKMVLR